MLFGWFDVVAVVFLTAGVFAGRRRGMSTELLGLVTWLIVVIAGGLLNPLMAQWLTRVSGLGGTFGCLGAYIGFAIILLGLGGLIRYRFGDKLVGSDVFGGYEYYLGMVAGTVRFLCILLFILAIVHAPQYRDSEIQAKIKAQQESLGSVYFPPFGQIQRAVFRQSIAGRFVDQHAPFLLLEAKSSGTGRSNEGIGRRREREVDEIMGR